jgi:hypothetical protein
MKQRLADAERMGPEYAESVRRYLSSIGSTGGKNSRRKLTKKEARRIALLRWGRVGKAAKQSGAGSATAKVSDHADSERGA